MIAIPDIERIIGAEAVDPHNDRIGKVSQVYVDAETDQPTWASVKTGLFGLSESLVPLNDATWDREALHVGVEKARVKDAPRVDPEAEISPDEQERLYEYYGLGTGTVAGGSGLGAPGGNADGYDAGPISDTGYGAGAGAAAGMGAAAGTGAAGTGARHRGGDGPAGPRFDRGQSHEADEDRVRTQDAGYGLVADEPEGPDVEGSGRTAGDGRGSGDFASRGTALEEENPVAEEAAAGTGSGYGTSDYEDISGRFVGRGTVPSGRTEPEMREAGATPAAGGTGTVPQMSEDGLAGAGMVGTQVPQGDAGMQTESAGMPQDTAGMQQGAGSQRSGGMRLRRYVISRQEVVAGPEESLPSPSADDSSVGMRMDDEDPRV